ncbi:ferrous iron transport protein A [Clostridium tepidiprofundi DSM 19306]|uniref:Ferrous iron transport protein A n=1 Tax=Clostridium tepidiprofundi DSM 19306 TaxID=1121338 RepID=A0A151B4J1_9CLOT|nr:FeoA family protein [Clostridium tepidiprofundi]KYH34710.1 ferrous iron transport protein A [Clostridium tepidiprofundi DSM 19306]
MSSVSLDKVKVGSQCVVEKIVEGSSVRRRVMDMGIVKGTRLKVNGKAPLGDPIEVIVRGYKLTLRKKEARDIVVQV